MNETTPATSTDRPSPTLSLARYRFRFRENTAGSDASSLSFRAGYLGSAWRGAFGHALRKTVCITGLPDCAACSLVDSCPYPTTFENRPPPWAKKLTRYPNVPNPYVLVPQDHLADAGEGTVNLGVTLLGPRTNDHLPSVAQALESAGRNGLTARRVKLQLIDIQVEVRDESNWTTIGNPSGGLASSRPRHPNPPVCPAAVRVRLITPLRIKRRDRFVTAADFDFRAFAANLLRRLSLLTYFYGDEPLETNFAELLRRAETVPVANANLRWQDWARYSSHQRARIKMGGLVGTFEIADSALDLFWPCLWLGQWTHIGKGCTMGLGRYLVEPADQDASSVSPWPTPRPL